MSSMPFLICKYSFVIVSCQKTADSSLYSDHVHGTCSKVEGGGAKEAKAE